MFDLIVNSLLFFVMAIGVWTIVCALYKMPWVYDLFVVDKYKQVEIIAWVAADEDGFIGVYSSKPHREKINGIGKWVTDGPSSYILCLNEKIKPSMQTFDITWNDDPVVATLIVNVTMAEIHKVKNVYTKTWKN